MLHSKFWQAFFALAPIIILFIVLFGYLFFIFSLVNSIPELEHSQNEIPSVFLQNFILFFVFIFVTIFISLGSLIFYILHAVQNPNLKQHNLLLIWILLFVLVSGIGQLIYWIVEIIGKKTGKSVDTTAS